MSFTLTHLASTHILSVSIGTDILYAQSPSAAVQSVY